MKKTLRIPKELTRAGVISEDGEGEKKSKRISISSDVPYLRYDWMADEEYYEVLSHKPDGISDARLKAGLPVLFNHRRDEHLGRATKYHNDGKRMDVGTMDDIIWSESENAQIKKKDVESGALVGTSVGYSILDDGVCIGEKDGLPVYEFKWEPHEFSFCTIEADITVGAGRTRSTKDEKGEEIGMKEISVEVKEGIDGKQKETNNQSNDMKLSQFARQHFEADKDKGGSEIDVVKERADAGEQAMKAYGEKRTKIRDWIKALPKEGWREAATTLAEGYLEPSDKRNFDEFRTEALAKCESLALTTPNDNAELGLSKKDRREFSLRKAIYEIAMQKRGVGKGLTGHELAVCKAAEKMYGDGDQRQFTGLCVPEDINNARFDEDNDLDSTGMRNLAEQFQRIGRELQMQRALNASVFTAGGALVGTDLLGGSMIDILRNAVLIGNGALAITELSGLMGNIAIPKQTGTSTVYWLAEGAAITQSQETFAQLVLSPKRNGVATQYTKQLLAQASIGVEAFVRTDQMLTLAVEEDRVAINGTGVGGEPIGILNTTGVLSNVTFGGNATWADMVAIEYGLENANVRTGQQAIVTSPLTKSYLKQTVVVANSTFPIFLWGKNDGGWPVLNGVAPGVVNEYPAYATKNVTTNVMIQGVFRNFIKARWAGFDVVVDPYTGALSELINIIVNSWMDQGLRYPQSFNATVDAPTAP